MRFASLAVIGAVVLAGVAHAGPTAIVGDDNIVHGFVWQGEETIDGQVTDPRGRAVAGVQVHAVWGDGDHLVATDRNGRYHVKPTAAGVAVLVFVYGDVRITSTAANSHGGADGETVDIREREVPTTPPKLKHRPKRPAYSDAASDRNAWIRAWLLLDIDASGGVVGLKLLDRPGYDLDAVAIASGFALDFEPARDRENHPVRTQMLWVIDWPPFWWVIDQGASVTAQIPDAAWSLPCRDEHGVEPTHVERSCARPTIANALALPWIKR
ncbi:MAG TPA: carboxypeptidase-like regulatory domain-containing protein [Kofleriaceae bacterium]|jgi:hypothetical protein